MTDDERRGQKDDPTDPVQHDQYQHECAQALLDLDERSAADEIDAWVRDGVVTIQMRYEGGER